MILVWGLAYISVAKTYQNVIWLIAVFVIEKLIYGIVWTNWIINISVSEVFEKDTFAGVFYSLYGINGWFFCLFFLFVFIRLMKNKAEMTKLDPIITVKDIRASSLWYQ